MASFKTRPPTQSANGQYQYDQEFFGRSLHQWIQSSHRHLSISSGWRYYPIQPGQFGYDNLALSVGYALQALDEADEEDLATVTADDLADIIHQGWIVNYCYWRDEQPWKKGGTKKEGNKREQNGYRKPSKPLKDTRREKCAQTDYDQLLAEEQDKDRIIAQYLLNELELAI